MRFLSFVRCLCAFGVGLSALSVSAVALGAQEMSFEPPTRQTEYWGGLARNSPRWGVLGDSPSMDLALFGIRFERTAGGLKFVGSTTSTTWHFDLIPVALISIPYLRGDRDCEEGFPCDVRPRTGVPPFSSGAVLGMGINPIGLTKRYRQRSVISPSVGVTAGALLFDRKVPTMRSNAFNFTVAAEIGLRIARPEQTGVALTYRLHHLSNGGLGRENPAVMSHLVTIGLVSPVRRGRVGDAQP